MRAGTAGIARMVVVLITLILAEEIKEGIQGGKKRRSKIIPIKPMFVSKKTSGNTLQQAWGIIRIMGTPIGGQTAKLIIPTPILTSGKVYSANRTKALIKTANGIRRETEIITKVLLEGIMPGTMDATSAGIKRTSPVTKAMGIGRP